MQLGGGDGMAVEQQGSFRLMVEPAGPLTAPSPAVLVPRQAVGPRVPRQAGAPGFPPRQPDGREQVGTTTSLAPLATPVPRETVQQATDTDPETDASPRIRRWARTHGPVAELVVSVGAGAAVGSMHPDHGVPIVAPLATPAGANF